MKECVFYYYIVSQINIICDKEKIGEEYLVLNNRVQEIFLDKSKGYYRTLSGFPARKEYFIWNSEHVKFLEKKYGISNFNENISAFEAYQDKVILKLGGNNIVYQPESHKDDALRCLSEIGNTYFLYMFAENSPMKNFKPYYNKFKNKISISESDPRLNSLFRSHIKIRESIKEFSDFYNIRVFYGVNILES